jgi:hypothetical protein
MMGSSQQTPLMKHIGIIPKLLVSVPEWMATHMGEGLSNVVKQRVVSDQK